MENNRKLSASCVVLYENKVLMVKHTYGAAKGKYLIPGGFSENDELPGATAQREVFEETGVRVEAGDLMAVRFTGEEVWCIFSARYLSGVPRSDGQENSDAVFMDVEEALSSDSVVKTTQEILKAVINREKSGLCKSSFVNSSFTPDTWQLFI